MVKEIKKNDTETKIAEEKKTRAYLSQAEVPGCSLEQAIKIARAIADNYASKPVTPLKLASALNVAPTSGPFRQLCGASIAYGLTTGGYNAQEISLEQLGKRIIKPLEAGDDLVAKREAILKPRVIREFLQKYNGSPLPRHDIAINVIEDLGVPKEKTESVLSLILDSAQSVGLIREIKNKQYIELAGVDIENDNVYDEPDEANINTKENTNQKETPATQPSLNPVSPTTSAQTNRRVFITHGKNNTFIEPIKKLLGFGELIPVVSVENQSVSKPVPDKVMEDMRSCSAAIIHVEAEWKLIDKEDNEHCLINSNVLIEIGAAMALYGRRYILLVREGVELPSNLQGLYEVRYKGDTLDGDATIRLLGAIINIKNNPLPDRYKNDV